MVVFYTQLNNPSMTSPLRNEALLLIDNSNADRCRDHKIAVRWADRTGNSAATRRFLQMPSFTAQTPSFIPRAGGFGCAPQRPAWRVRIAPVVDSTDIATCSHLLSGSGVAGPAPHAADSAGRSSQAFGAPGARVTQRDTGDNGRSEPIYR